MRVALLCPGPSLGLYAQIGGDYAAKIGVNQAVEAYSCDWWVFKDRNILADFGEGRKYGMPHPPRPTGLVMIGELKQSFMDMNPETETQESVALDPEIYEWAKTCRHRYIKDWELNGFPCQAAADKWKRFTVGSALVLAYMLGASDIDCYGCDMKGTNDYNQRPPRRESDRSEERWRLERETWDLLEGWLKERGITVTRYTVG